MGGAPSFSAEVDSALFTVSDVYSVQVRNVSNASLSMRDGLVSCRRYQVATNDCGRVPKLSTRVPAWTVLRMKLDHVAAFIGLL